jgi:hypothetical protein
MAKPKCGNWACVYWRSGHADCVVGTSKADHVLRDGIVTTLKNPPTRRPLTALPPPTAGELPEPSIRAQDGSETTTIAGCDFSDWFDETDDFDSSF